MVDVDAAAPVQREYFRTYLELIHNAVGSRLFRTFYVRSESGEVFDSLEGGVNACAFFVSGILTLLKKLEGGVHGTVDVTVEDLRKSGWRAVDEAPKPGDVIVWQPLPEGSPQQKHIGFSIGNGRAISNSSSQGVPVEHDEHFDELQRPFLYVFRMDSWS